MAGLCGVNVDRTISLTFVMGAALAAVAGVMATLYYGVIDFFIGFLAGIKAFTAAVLGGIGSIPGAMLGGLLLGMVEAFWSGYFSIEYKDVAAFSLLVLVLIFLPTGLLGTRDRESLSRGRAGSERCRRRPEPDRLAGGAQEGERSPRVRRARPVSAPGRHADGQDRGRHRPRPASTGC